MCFFKTLTKQGDKVNKTEKLPKPIAVYPSVLAPKLTANRPTKIAREPSVTG
ncbi:hypothetical protein JDS70_20400 [Bacillus cereus]|nr:hypothetical protein [Bacillus cereus]